MITMRVAFSSGIFPMPGEKKAGKTRTIKSGDSRVIPLLTYDNVFPQCG